MLWKHNSSSKQLAVKKIILFCSSKVNLTGVNGHVIISGCGDDNPDDARREAHKNNSTSVLRGELRMRTQLARFVDGKTKQQSILEYSKAGTPNAHAIRQILSIAMFRSPRSTDPM
jgi:hypothetical protein